MAYNLSAAAHIAEQVNNSHSMKALDVDDVSWNGVFRLVVLSAVATGGSMGGIFVISAVTVVEPYQVRGNAYLVSMVMGHLLVTVLVLPASCVAILAGIPHEPAICNFQWLTTCVCFIVSILSFMFMAVENFLGLSSLVTYELCCTKTRIVLVIGLIWGSAIGFVVGQHVMGYGPTFCKQKYLLWIPYHVSMGALLIVLPVLISVWYFTRAVFKLKSFKLQLESLEDPMAYVLTDENLLKSNIVTFVVMMLMWMPCVVVATISVVRPVAQHLMDSSWWVALSNSCAYSYLYAATNREFRDAFNKLFYYCCCKSHVTFARKTRDPRRACEIGLRVHIIPGLNIYAQRKEVTKESRSTCQKGTSDL